MVEIEWSPSAQDELNKILDYIAQDSVEYALTFYDQVHEKVHNLSIFPKMGRKLPDLEDPNIRELIFKNYRVIYRILEDKIQIIRIFHGSKILDFEL